MASDRTEKATPRRLREARRKGQNRPEPRPGAGRAAGGRPRRARVGGPLLVTGLGHALRVGLQGLGDSPIRTVEPRRTGRGGALDRGDPGPAHRPGEPGCDPRDRGGRGCTGRLERRARGAHAQLEPAESSKRAAAPRPVAGRRRPHQGRGGRHGPLLARGARRAEHAAGCRHPRRVDPVHAGALGWAQVERLLRQAAMFLVALGSWTTASSAGGRAARSG